MPSTVTISVIPNPAPRVSPGLFERHPTALEHRRHRDVLEDDHRNDKEGHDRPADREQRGEDRCDRVVRFLEGFQDDAYGRRNERPDDDRTDAIADGFQAVNDTGFATVKRLVRP